jgi:hypothetical protein
VAVLTGHSFFPRLITQPFHDGLVVAFWFAIAVSVVAAIASAFTGKARGERAAGEPLAADAEPPEAELAWAGAEEATAQEAADTPGVSTAGATTTEASTADAGTADAGTADAGTADAGTADAGATISGVVTRPDGAPAAGVTVTALDSANAVAGRTVTGADGRYQLRVPGPGDYVLVAAGLRAREVSLDAGAHGDAPILLMIGGRP